MPFENGSLALTICTLSTPLPEDFLEKLAKSAAGKLDDVQEEPELGWVSGRHLLENEINDTTAISAGHLYLNLRKTERKIPSSLLRAICRRDELAYMKANDTLNVPRLERKRIKEDAVKRNLMKMPPSISGTSFVVDRALNVMYIGTGSLNQVDLIVAAFVKDLGVEPIPVTINELMIKLFKEEANALPNLAFTDQASADMDVTPGRDFLTWLWYYSELNGGEISLECGDFQLGIEGPLTFAYSAEAKGAEESVLKKGCPQLSAEAKSALAVGKKLKKAKLTMAREQDVWSFTFDADKFTFSGLNLPDGVEMEESERFAERVEYLHVFHQAVEAYFKKFVDSITGATAGEVAKDIRRWAQDRESF